MRFWASDGLLLLVVTEDFVAAEAGLLVLVAEGAGLVAPAFPKKLIMEFLAGTFDFDAAAVEGAEAGVSATGAGAAEEGDGDTTGAAGLAAGAVGFAAKALLGFGAARAAALPRLVDFEMVTPLFRTILYTLMSLPFCIWVASALETDNSDRSFRGEGSRL